MSRRSATPRVVASLLLLGSTAVTLAAQPDRAAHRSAPAHSLQPVPAGAAQHHHADTGADTTLRNKRFP